jgi:ketosteroid isomerase-like protein
MRRITIVTVVVLLELSGIAPVFGEPPKADPARAPIERADKAFCDAFGRGDFAAIGKMYSAEAIAFPPESDMVKGRSAIEAFWKGARDTGVKSVELNVVDVTSSGNLASETGTAALHVQGVGGGADAIVNVKYVVVWRKEGGVWRLYRDIWNSLPAATAPMAAPPPATTPH